MSGSETENTGRELEQLEETALGATSESPEKRSEISADFLKKIVRRVKHKHNELQQQTEKLEKEKMELKQILNKYENYFDFSPVASFIIDDNGTIIEANFKGASLINVSRLWLTGKKFSSYITGDSLNSYVKMINDAYHNLSGESKNVNLKTETGQVISVDIYADYVSEEKTDEERYQMIVLDRTAGESELGDLREKTRQLEKMSLHMQSARDEERSGVAKFVHDELGQTMTALKMNLIALKNIIGKNNYKAEQRIEESVKMVNTGLDAVQTITGKLTPGIIQDLGLMAALESEIEEYESWSNLECHLKANFYDLELGKSAAIDIFRIIRELLTNAARHSAGSAVFIHLNVQDEYLQIRVRDNGKGALPEDLNTGDAFGIMAIKERVRKNSGDVIFDTSLSIGLEVRLSFPLEKITKSG